MTTQTDHRDRRFARLVDLGLVLSIALLTLGIGFWIRGPCITGDWSDGRQYRLPFPCYSDIVPLYATEHLQEGRLPFLNACPPSDGQCDEYPVLSMYFMRVAATFADDFSSFFVANSVMLAIAGLVATALLFDRFGYRALMFAAAPSLAVYSFVNWDLFAVALAVAGIVLFLRGRDAWAGVMLGLGAAAKLYPALLVLPLIAQRWTEGGKRRAGLLAGTSAGTWIAVNLPFAVAAPESWSTFFTFNRERPADFDSLWYISCQHFDSLPYCFDTPLVNLLSLIAFVVLAGVVYMVGIKTRPDLPKWQFVFPLLALFLLTNKVYSPQYSLWLLPLFPMAFPRLPFFVAFSIADVAVFFTRFPWLGTFSGLDGVPFVAFETAVLVRAAVLVASVIAFLWPTSARQEADARRPRSPAPAAPASAT